jgi:hypothetical protein
MTFFPGSVEKGFWQQIKEAQARGDALEQTSVSLPHVLKLAAASWLVQVGTSMLANELDDLGLANVRQSIGLGSRKRRDWFRASLPRLDM